MAQYKSVQYLEAILWPGWTDSPWSEEFVQFFGPNWPYIIKADNSVSPPKTLLYITAQKVWKSLPNGNYVLKIDGNYSMMSPGAFALKDYELVI